MVNISQSNIVVGELRDRNSKSKRLFSGHFLSFLNKATVRHRNGRRTNFYWLPYAQSAWFRENEWALLAVYRDNATIEHTNGWTYGDNICGPVIVKKSELMMPCITIGPITTEEASIRQTAKTMMRGFWHIAENPYSPQRQLFAENYKDLVAGTLLFS